MLSFTRVLNSVECSVDGCPTRANNSLRLRVHFMYRHWNLKVAILQEVPEPLSRCDKSGMHMPAARQFKQRRTERCNKATERRLRQIYVEKAKRCVDIEFSLYRREGGAMVDGVSTFKYLGRPLGQTYNYWPEIRQNVLITRTVWGSLRNLLRR